MADDKPEQVLSPSITHVLNDGLIRSLESFAVHMLTFYTIPNVTVWTAQIEVRNGLAEAVATATQAGESTRATPYLPRTA